MTTRLDTSERYFLTGSAGFVGANLLARLLEESKEVHVLLKPHSDIWRMKHLLDNPFLHIHYGDLSDQTALKKMISKIRPDIVYHLATKGAYSTQNDPTEIFETNLMGTLHLLESVKNLPLKLFVNTSSTSEYGNKDHPMVEDELLEPDSYYAVSKVAATQLCRQYAQQFKLPIVTLRLFSVYGPWEAPTRLMPTLLSHLKSGEMMMMAKPDTARDFIYISDVIDLYRKIETLAQFPGEVFNVGTGDQTSLKELADHAQALTSKAVTFAWDKSPGKSWDKSIWLADTSKSKKHLNWSANTSIQKGLELFWKWYLTHDQIYHSMLH